MKPKNSKKKKKGLKSDAKKTKIKQSKIQNF